MYSYFLISFYFLFLELTTMFQITIVIIKIKRKNYSAVDAIIFIF